jgi:hypothetical protein
MGSSKKPFIINDSFLTSKGLDFEYVTKPSPPMWVSLGERAKWCNVKGGEDGQLLL